MLPLYRRLIFTAFILLSPLCFLRSAEAHINTPAPSAPAQATQVVQAPERSSYTARALAEHDLPVSVAVAPVVLPRTRRPEAGRGNFLSRAFRALFHRKSHAAQVADKDSRVSNANAMKLKSSKTVAVMPSALAVLAAKPITPARASSIPKVESGLIEFTAVEPEQEINASHINLPVRYAAGWEAHLYVNGEAASTYENRLDASTETVERTFQDVLLEQGENHLRISLVGMDGAVQTSREIVVYRTRALKH